MSTDRPVVAFVYEWTNLVNGKRYIGAHIGRLDDGYIGSGSAFRAAVQKYGIESFERTILWAEHDDPENVWIVEATIVEERGAVADPTYYNIRPGGAGANIEGRLSVAQANASRVWTPESRERVRVAASGRRDSPEVVEKRAANWRGRKHTPEARAKMSATKKGRPVSFSSLAALIAANTGRVKSPEEIARLSASLKGRTFSDEARAKMSAAARARVARTGSVAGKAVRLAEEVSA